MTEQNDSNPKWTVDEFDVMGASWEIATIFCGGDDGSSERGDIECQIQDVLKKIFDDRDKIRCRYSAPVQRKLERSGPEPG